MRRTLSRLGPSAELAHRGNGLARQIEKAFAPGSWQMQMRSPGPSLRCLSGFGSFSTRQCPHRRFAAQFLQAQWRRRSPMLLRPPLVTEHAKTPLPPARARTAAAAAVPGAVSAAAPALAAMKAAAVRAAEAAAAEVALGFR